MADVIVTRHDRANFGSYIVDGDVLERAFDLFVQFQIVGLPEPRRIEIGGQTFFRWSSDRSTPTKFT